MKDLNFYSLLKFGSETDIYDLYENGTLFLNTLQYFRSLEDQGLRGDNYEGILEIKNYPPGTFDLVQEGKVLAKGIRYENLHLKKSAEKLIGNVYCMYALRPLHLERQNIFRFDQRVGSFGSHFLMINDEGIQEFLDKFFAELNKRKLYYDYGFVNYYSKFSLTGELNIFMKPDDYAYQNEFRVYVQHLTDEPLLIKIGSLKKIAKVYQTKVLPDMTIERNIPVI